MCVCVCLSGVRFEPVHSGKHHPFYLAEKHEQTRGKQLKRRNRVNRPASALPAPVNANRFELVASKKKTYLLNIFMVTVFVPKKLLPRTDGPKNL